MANERKDSPMIADALERTGFPLEHRTGRAFQAAGWTLFTNKYYVDNVTGDAREIDLIAYKVAELKEFSVVTGVIVSCKKTIKRKWAFLTRKYHKNPNKDMRPIHHWSNVVSFTYLLNQEGARNSLHMALAKVAPLLWEDPSREVFGTQELIPIGKKNGSSDEVDHYDHANDQAFFSSICTLMKAQAYEADRLADRQVKPRIYVFSLLSVMDGELIEVDYDGKAPVARDVDSQPYIAHYIINNREQFSRINFVSIGALDKAIAECGEAHEAMVKHLEKAHIEFYQSCIKDNAIRRYLLPQFAKRIHSLFAIYAPALGKIDADDINLIYENGIARIAVFTNADAEEVAKANADARFRKSLARALLSIYRYEGEFEIVEDVPF